MLHRIRLGFRNASARVILAIGEKVLAGMRGNPDFPDPPVSMEILEQALGEFSLAIQAQAKGGTLATAIRNNARRKKNKRKKRHAVSIGRPICGVFQLLRRRITRFMFTCRESCPGLPHFFKGRKRLAKSASVSASSANFETTTPVPLFP